VTAGAWPVADERLVRRYQWLLLAYPGHYRRRHGTEMLTTLLEMAEPGRTRPSVGEVRHLVSSGVRRRFRLPASGPAMAAAAVLVTVALGVFGAAGGSWLGERTFTALPGEAETLRMLTAAVADPAGDGISAAVRRSEPGNADYIAVHVTPRVQRPDAVATWTVEEARDGLAAAGWTITEFTVRPGYRPDGVPLCAEGQEPGTPGDECVNRFDVLRRGATLLAERDGLVLNGYVHDSIGGEPGKVWVGGIGGTLFAERSTAYLPLVVAGGLLGAVTGWLLFAALAHRVRTAPRGRAQSAVALTGVALTVSVIPIWAIVLNAVLLGTHLTDPLRSVHTLHAVLRPGPYVEGSPAWLIPGCALVAAAAAMIGAYLARDTAGLARDAAGEQPRGTAQPV
jgi:hypothetical protein